MNKKGFIFTTDAMMAMALIIIVASIVLFQGTTRMSDRYSFEQANFMSEDGVSVISTLKFSDVNESERDLIIAETNLTAEDLDMNLVSVIGALWAEGTPSSLGHAQDLTEEYIGALIPEGYSYGLYVNDDVIYADPINDYSVMSASRRMISGIHEGMPLKGISARLSISNILSKDTAKYLYFGGFVGEGNITKTFDLPDVIGNVTNVYIEMDVGSNFTMFVNGNYAGNYTMDSPVAMFSKNWTMSAVYYQLFSPGGNVVQINFTDAQNSFIGGGYIKVGYNTSQMDTTMIRLVNGNVSERFDFSGVNGFINIYSSFYVPGTLNAMGLHLHLNNPYTTYLYIGGTKVYENTTNQTQYVDLNNTALSSMLNYGAMSGKTIPIRLGIKNMTGLGQGSDVVLTTDVSGSMAWRMDVDNVNGATIDCDDPMLADPSTSRISVAKCADKDFVSTILNNEGQRVGLVNYSTSTRRTVYLTSDNTTLNSNINSYIGSGSTCISCGIKNATDMLATTINVTTLVNNGTAWRYNDSYMDSAPPDDNYGRKWYDINYSLESSWSSGNAVFGSGAGAIPVVTTLTAGGGGNVTYAEMWDDNRTTIPVGFESGYNATGNTFGWNTGDDGWDYDPPLDGNAPYGFDDDVDYNLVVNGLLEFDTRIPNYAAASTQNRCSNYDCSGAYGIEVNITQQMYDIISTGGTANVSFQYNWTPNPGVFEAADEVWIKARWTDRLGVVRDLGTEMSNAGGDTTPEINRSDNPNNPIYTAYARLNVTNWITGPGTYYLDFGGKLYADASNEWGYFRFDDILINISNGTNTIYPYLWDDNLSSIPVSFETGYYALMNTFGWNMGDDGWDYDPMNNAGPYGYDDNVDYNKAVNGKVEFDMRTPDYTSTQNRCNNYDCSGAYGIQIDITQQQYDILANNGMARVSFMYEWDDNNAEVFEDTDEVWIKARWTDRTGTLHDLGTEQSTGGGTDTTPEIDFRTNPNSDIPQTYTVQDVTNWIDGPGTYYLDFGGKLLADASNEWGYFRFDDVLLEIRNGTEAYYFRKNFTVDDVNKVGRGFLKVASDDMADIYLNGRLIDADPGPLHSAKYWNRIELIDRSYFRQGDNVIAAKLYNSLSSSRFDMRLEAFNESRNKAMLVMSDGDANYCAPPLVANCGESLAKPQAIEFACNAYENYGIILHAVGFSNMADTATLQSVADCGHGMFRASGDADELRQIYQDIANAMISYTTQRSNITGEYTITTLYPDSYIEYNYTPIANLDYGEISLSFESQTFGETSGNSSVESPKNGSYWIPPDVAVVDAKATSYSSEFWTSIVNMKNETSGWTNVYNLSTYGADFTKLGDPYIVYLPTSNIGINQTNYVAVNTGYNSTAFTGGSPHGRVIYNLKIKGTSSYGEISARADGCSWTVEQYNLKNVTIKIPSDYNGTKSCEFSSAQIVYDLDDSIDNAAVLMFKQLDVTEDNRIDIAIDQTNIDMRIIKVVDLPWMWGPAILKLQVWK